jgi:hypothetical protein
MCIVCEAYAAYDEHKDSSKLDDLLEITELDISYCNEVTKLPPMPKLQRLKCYCRKLTKIGDYPMLTGLSCYDCQNLSEIGNCPNLYYLDCRYCQDLIKLNDYPKLGILHIVRYTRPRSLGHYPSLFYLRYEYYDSTATNPEKYNIIINQTSEYNKYYNYKNIWLDIEYNKNFADGLQSIINLQRWARKNMRYLNFKKWIRSKEFAQWFYASDQLGGRLSKAQISKVVQKI